MLNFKCQILKTLSVKGLTFISIVLSNNVKKIVEFGKFLMQFSHHCHVNYVIFVIGFTPKKMAMSENKIFCHNFVKKRFLQNKNSFYSRDICNCVVIL